MTTYCLFWYSHAAAQDYKNVGLMVDGGGVGGGAHDQGLYC